MHILKFVRWYSHFRYSPRVTFNEDKRKNPPITPCVSGIVDVKRLLQTHSFTALRLYIKTIVEMNILVYR